MPSFGKSSLDRLSQAHPDLQRLCHAAIEIIDFAVVCSYRGQAEQEKAVADGASTKHFPTSKHNRLPSLAVDLCPYRGGMQWRDNEAFYYMAGIIKGLAASMDIAIRWGGDWDSDGDLHDQQLYDLPHIEVIVS